MASEVPQATDDPFDRWLDEARQGSEQALTECLEQARAYLLSHAADALTAELRVKVSPSDLVQESMIDAHQGFAGFHGSTREELLRWLRRILANNAADVARKFRQASKRDVARETQWAAQDEDNAPIELVARDASPSSLLGHLEDEQLVLAHLAKLPEDYRRAIELRNLRGLSYHEIGQQMGRSAEAVRKLWTRAFERLAQELIAKHGSRQHGSSAH